MMIFDEASSDPGVLGTDVPAGVAGRSDTIAHAGSGRVQKADVAAGVSAGADVIAEAEYGRARMV